MRRFLFGLVILWLLVAALGCGGGGGSSVTPVPGALSLSINWPERSRALGAPSSALSFKLTVASAATDGDLVISGSRGPDASAHQTPYSANQSVNNGTFAYSISFFANENGAGIPVAVASGTVTINGTTELPSVQLGGVVSTVTIAADQQVRVGLSRSIPAVAKNAEGTMLALSPGSFVWSVASGGDHLTQAAGIFTGVSAGEATINVSVDGVQGSPTVVNVVNSVAVSLNVGPLATWAAFQDGANGTWTRVNLPPDHIVRANVTSPDGKYGWAYTSIDPADHSARGTQQILCTVGEATDLTWYGISSTGPARRAIKVRFNGVAAGESVTVGWPYSSTHTYTVTDPVDLNINEGTQTLYAYTSLQGVPQKMVFARNIAQETAEITFDFAGSSAFNLEKVSYPENVTRVRLILDSKERRGTAYSAVRTSNPNSFYLPPTTQVTSNDCYVTEGLSVDDATGTTLFARYSVTRDSTVDYSDIPAWQPAIGKADDGKSIDLTLPELTGGRYSLLSVATKGTYQLIMSVGWHGAGGVQYRTPDLSLVAGWPAFGVGAIGIRYTVSTTIDTLSLTDRLQRSSFPLDGPSDWNDAVLGSYVKRRTWNYDASVVQ